MKPKNQNLCKCGCKEKDHELYDFMDGTKERIGCLNCGDISCKKFEPQEETIKLIDKVEAHYERTKNHSPRNKPEGKAEDKYPSERVKSHSSGGTLSDKKSKTFILGAYSEEDIKEFIKKRDELFEYHWKQPVFDVDKFREEKRKLAGDELLK